MSSHIKNFIDPQFFTNVKDQSQRASVIKDLEKVLFNKVSKLRKLEKEVEIIQTVYTQICV